MGSIVVLRTGGVIELLPAEEDVFSQAKEILGGAHIEVARTMIPNLVMLIDEFGKGKKLPPNDMGTALYPHKMDFICGDAVLVDARGGELCALKDSGYVQKVLGFLGFGGETSGHD